MTEREWMTCHDPIMMLEFLRDKGSDRKLRLFGVACCRSIWHLLSDERTQNAVAVAEKYADGLARKKDIRAAYDTARAVDSDDLDGVRRLVTRAVCEACADGEGLFLDCTSMVARDAAVAAGHDSAWPTYRDGNVYFDQRAADTFEKTERAYQALFLRDIFGNPFRPVVFAPAWLSPKIVALAQAIYNERAFDRLAILADALEEAGCHDAEILGHCRQPGPHVRGCWVVDLLLGKE